MSRKSLLNKLRTFEKGRVLSEGVKSPVVADESRKKIRDYALEELLGYSSIFGKKRFKNQEEFDNLPDNEKDNLINMAFSYKINSSTEDARKIFSEEGENLLMENSNEDNKYSRDLLKIANTEQIMGESSPESREILTDSGTYFSYREVVKKLKEDEQIDPRVEGQLKNLASEGASDDARKKLRSMGYSDDLVELGAKYAALVPGEIDKEKLIKGGENLLEKEKERLSRKHGEEFEYKISKAVGKTLVGMVRSGNPNKEMTALDLFYNAFEGRSLNEKSFRDYYNN